MARAGGGKPPTSTERVNVRLRRTQAVEMLLAGVPRPEIAAALGYKTTSALGQDINRHLDQTAAVPTAELRALELARLDQSLQRLDEARAVVLRVLAKEHVTVQQGRVVFLGDKPLVDDGPILAAVDRLIAIEAQRIRVQERRAKLLGLDAATKVVISDDVVDAEIKRLCDELERAAAAEAATVEGPAAADS